DLVQLAVERARHVRGVQDLAHVHNGHGGLVPLRTATASRSCSGRGSIDRFRIFWTVNSYAVWTSASFGFWVYFFRTIHCADPGYERRGHQHPAPPRSYSARSRRGQPAKSASQVERDRGAGGEYAPVRIAPACRGAP